MLQLHLLGFQPRLRFGQHAALLFQLFIGHAQLFLLGLQLFALALGFFQQREQALAVQRTAHGHAHRFAHFAQQRALAGHARFAQLGGAGREADFHHAAHLAFCAQRRDQQLGGGAAAQAAADGQVAGRHVLQVAQLAAGGHFAQQAVGQLPAVGGGRRVEAMAAAAQQGVAFQPVEHAHRRMRELAQRAHRLLADLLGRQLAQQCLGHRAFALLLP